MGLGRAIGAERFRGWEVTGCGSVGAVTGTCVDRKVAGCDAGTEAGRAGSENDGRRDGEGWACGRCALVDPAVLSA